MSITDSTTTLDTAWTEGSFVEFTTGVLSTLATCVTEVESKIQRGTLSTSTIPTLANVQNWLRRAKLELMAVRSFTYARKYASATLTAGDYRVGLPEDYNGNLTLRDTLNDRYIEVVGNDYFDKKYPDLSAESQNEPLVATVKNMELWLSPPVSSAVTLEIDYDRSGAESTADSFAWMPELDRFLCCDFAIAESFDSIHMWGEGDRYRQKWHAGIGLLVRADGKRKWKHRQSAISVFQEHTLKSFQPNRN